MVEQTEQQQDDDWTPKPYFSPLLPKPCGSQNNEV